MMRMLCPVYWSSRRATTSSLAGFSLARRYLSRHWATAYSMRIASGRATRTSVQLASAIQPRPSSSRHGTSYFFGPIRLKTSPSRASSRISVAVGPRRRRAAMWAVTGETGAGAADVAAGVERVGGIPLVIADVERQARASHVAQVDRQIGAGGVAGEVLRRVADADERLLQHTAEGRVDRKALRVEPVAEVG